jgi:hypothetical protein
VLEEKAGHRCLHQPILIPLRMSGDELPHGQMQIFLNLIHDTHLSGGMVWRLGHGSAQA